ncbi:hypothetical protein SAMN02949497_2192 [Methylomagnum ishizawai]|uniref:Uncharacterized protein n=1 Tax=Methylomagnum ishizawai TaxID=1760988 RepID=A0A1Y6CX48_9GAMM|nr:hypothetical protein [Methylomagnum ishizawai]SMF94856.1 hypothetical protein SAMN02949497_2192 [Methylomagnum ishizawai]
MNRAHRTAEDWRKLKLAQAWREFGPPGLPDLVPCVVRLESSLATDPDTVEQAIRGFDAQAGWLERQSRLALVLGGASRPGPDGDFDPILAGELAGARGSLWVRRVAEGWRLTHITDIPAADGGHLSQERSLAGVDHLPATGQAFGAHLRYRVYWRYDEDSGWRQFAARLLGFA